MSALMVRPALPEDVDAVVAITNHYIRHSLCIMKEQDKDVEERSEWLERYGDRYPLVVALSDWEVVGWGALTPHSERTAYRYTVHDAVYVREDRRGQGIGTTILRDLVSKAKELGYHSVIAVIGASQPASLALHRKFGFKDVAYLEQVGFKFGQWVDVVHLQLML
jgi:phosphinothricin acetyltransferase